MYSYGKFLESPIEIKYLLFYIWVTQFYQGALSGPVSFCSAQGIWIVDVEREKGGGVELVEVSIVLRIVTEPFKRPLSDLSI